MLLKFRTISFCILYIDLLFCNFTFAKSIFYKKSSKIYAYGETVAAIDRHKMLKSEIILGELQLESLFDYIHNVTLT